jgi:hypothetical protein
MLLWSHIGTKRYFRSELIPDRLHLVPSTSAKCSLGFFGCEPWCFLVQTFGPDAESCCGVLANITSHFSGRHVTRFVICIVAKRCKGAATTLRTDLTLVLVPLAESPLGSPPFSSTKAGPKSARPARYGLKSTWLPNKGYDEPGSRYPGPSPTSSFRYSACRSRH